MKTREKICLAIGLLFAVTVTMAYAAPVKNPTGKNNLQVATSTPITITGYSWVNTPTNMAIATTTREIVVAYSNNHSQITTIKKLTNQITGITREIAQLNASLVKDQNELTSLNQFIASSTTN